MADAGKEKKRGPEWELKIPSGPSRLRRETAFICNIRFKNDLPEIPCDPKLLLPPYSKDDIAAFKLTELEKDLKKDLLFEADLGIPIHAWNIEQYSYSAEAVLPPPLHPDDFALVADDEELEPQRARLRGDAAEVSWLLRTKYIAAEAGLKRGIGAGAKGEAAAAAAAVAAAGEGAAGEEAQDLNAALLEQIEAQFVAARAPLVHWKDPTLRPVEVLPVFPDTLMEGRSCVLATFDNDPLADLEAAQRLPPEQRARMSQASQLKSFRDPKGKQFVALLVPQTPPEQGDEEADGGELGVGGIRGEALLRDYQWVREYTGKARLDDSDTTFLFRFAADGTVRFQDLNTRLDLRKRKRGAAPGEEDEEDHFQQPEKVVVRRPGTWEEGEEAGEEAQQQGSGAAAGGLQEQQQEDGWADAEGGAAAAAAGGGSDAEMADGDAAAGQGGDGGGEEEGQQQQEDYGGRADANAALRDVFGDDDDDI